MKTKRINAHIIRAYADGYDVEFKIPTHTIDARETNYQPWSTDSFIHVGDPRYEWRIAKNSEDMYP